MFRTAAFARSTLGFGLAALGLVMLMAGADPAPAAAQQLEQIRVNRVPIAAYAPADLAIERGWFKEEGIDVTVATVASSAVAMQALVANRLELIYGALDAAMKARANGFDVMVIAGNNSARKTVPDGGALLARADSGITSLKQLEGKIVIVNVLNNVNWAYTREAVLRAGGDPAKIQFLEIGFPQMNDAVTTGRAAAASNTEPFTTLGVESGLKPISYMFVEVQPGLNITGWIARGPWVKENPKAVAAFRKVLQRSINFLEGNEEERIATIVKHTQLKEDIVRKAKFDPLNAKLDPDDLQKQIVIYQRHGMIDKVFDAKEMIAP